MSCGSPMSPAFPAVHALIMLGDMGVICLTESSFFRLSEGLVFSPPTQKSRGGQRRQQQRTWLRDGDAVRDEDARGAVGETGHEGELAQVVESAGPAVAIARPPAKYKRTDRAEFAGRHFQRVAGAGDELQGAGPIGGPNALVVGAITPLPLRLAKKAVWPASFSTRRI